MSEQATYNLTGEIELAKLVTAAQANGQQSLTILRLLPSEVIGWTAFPLVLMRMERFITRFQLDAPFPVVSQYVRTHWASGSEQVAVWAAIDGGKVVGHCLAAMEAMWGIPYAMVIQIELDTPNRTTLTQRAHILSELETWAKAQGAKTIKMLTPRTPEAWTRMAGFQFDKVLMRKEVS